MSGGAVFVKTNETHNAVVADGGLEVVGRAQAGKRPRSVAERGGIVYVLAAT